MISAAKHTTDVTQGQETASSEAQDVVSSLSNVSDGQQSSLASLSASVTAPPPTPTQTQDTSSTAAQSSLPEATGTANYIHQISPWVVAAGIMVFSAL